MSKESPFDIAITLSRYLVSSTQIVAKALCFSDCKRATSEEIVPFL
jgi:hypothetical protein